jgi:hypothetical protein
LRGRSDHNTQGISVRVADGAAYALDDGHTNTVAQFTVRLNRGTKGAGEGGGGLRGTGGWSEGEGAGKREAKSRRRGGADGERQAGKGEERRVDRAESREQREARKEKRVYLTKNWFSM